MMPCKPGKANGDCQPSKRQQELIGKQQRSHTQYDLSDLVRIHRDPCGSKPPLESLDAIQLIERCKAGEPSAWNELVRRYHGMISRFAYSLCGNAADAGDITSEVYLRLLHSLHTFRRDAKSFRFWLFRIVRNTYIDVCVRDSDRGHASLDTPISQEETRERHEVIDPSPSPESLCLGRVQLCHVAEGIRFLPSYQRQVLALFLAGSSYEEITATTGLSMGTVKSRLNRARRTLLERLEAEREL